MTAMVVSLCATSNANADVSGIYVEVHDGSGWVAVDGFADRSQGQSGLVSGSAIPLTTDGDAFYRIYAIAPATTDIGNITQDDHTGTGTPTILIGEAPLPVFSRTTPVPHGGRHLTSLTGAFDRKVQYEIYGDITGAVSASELGRCGAAGTVSGSIIHNVHNAASPPVCGDLFTETVSSTGLVESRGADIPLFDVDVDLAGTLRATGGGNILEVSGDGVITGTIVSTEGKIGSIELLSTNDIGSQGSLATISAKSGIDLIDCAALYADVTANANSGAGDVKRCITRVGDFEGSMTARRIGESGVADNLLDIRGDLDADIVSTDDLTQGVFIGGEFTSDGSITLPNGGLQHQIFFNTNDNASAFWDGTVTVGALVLDSSVYDLHPLTLGGGSVGFIKYGINDNACAPHNGALVGGNGQGSLSQAHVIVLEHYGPIDITDEDEDAVTIVRRAYPLIFGGSNPWYDVTGDYDVVIKGDGSDAEYWRRLDITPADEDPFDTGWEYRVSPTSNLTTNRLDHIDNKQIANYTYQIRVIEPFDLNLNGSVDAPDITVWAADPIDLNDDQTADSQDLVDLLEEISNNN